MKSFLVLAAFAAAAAFASASVQQNGAGPNGPNNASCTQQGPQGSSCQQQGRARQRGRQGQCGGQQGQCGGQGQGQGRRRGPNGQGGQGMCTSGGSAALAAAPAFTVTPAYLRQYVGALQSTLEKELYARDYYTAADQALNAPPRFANLASAEQNHADAVANMITYLGGTPVMSHNIPIVVPATVAEADATCVQIELLVIGVYDRLIRGCPDPAILPVLNNIQASNYNHLDAVGG
ncbi:MAG: hypothetical protein H6828_05550 [Planctomycetes bacterium]|nr:hypothetical protein [Planctomycetota bacterium]